jgi:hypothetical protein
METAFTKMNLLNRLIFILKGLEDAFDKNELAYLAATSKIENPIRDRIAYALHDSIEPDLLVHREWKDARKKKADLAITDLENRPKCIIELKAHSAPTYEKGYSNLIRQDIEKMYYAGEIDSELYIIFLFNHLYFPKKIEAKYNRSVKYFDLLNYATKKFGNVPDLSADVEKHWQQHLTDIGLPPDKGIAVPIKGGTYYDKPMIIHAFVYGPLTKSIIKGILGLDPE